MELDPRPCRSVAGTLSSESCSLPEGVPWQLWCPLVGACDGPAFEPSQERNGLCLWWHSFPMPLAHPLQNSATATSHLQVHAVCGSRGAGPGDQSLSQCLSGDLLMLWLVCNEVPSDPFGNEPGAPYALETYLSSA